jgi:hypothetical protein
LQAPEPQPPIKKLIKNYVYEEIEKPQSSSDSGRTSASKEFQHYERHTNAWLFNDFSVKVDAKKVYRFLAGGN